MARAGHRIVCAAIKLRDGRVICGVRHFDQLMLQALPHPDVKGAQEMMRGHQQGFVDNDYQFLDRATAWRVALKAYQFDPESPEFKGIHGTLHSEDLW